MMKALIAVLVLSLMCRWATGKWPWDYLRGPSTRAEAHRQARMVLGVERGADRAAIIRAHRNVIAVVHPDRGGTTAAMQEANAARDLLLGDLPDAATTLADEDQP
ncbi:MAG: J domain-containing protein [Sphingomonadales bacterium]|nr:J domain-containing protein [Sphingomonadales bacterium]NCQ21176.1 J domain-containing protein [Sphingomonadales bacterium]NCT03949.1 J domain-containing protein [Sphingomonadales bacterium]